MVTSTTYF